MKATTKDWFLIAEDHLLSAQKLEEEAKLTHFVTFHCQQCLEKSLKGIMEEQHQSAAESHNLLKLFNAAHIQLIEDEVDVIEKMNSEFAENYNPDNLGFMPHRKPAIDEAKRILHFTEKMFLELKKQVKTKNL